MGVPPGPSSLAITGWVPQLPVEYSSTPWGVIPTTLTGENPFMTLTGAEVAAPSFTGTPHKWSVPRCLLTNSTLPPSGDQMTPVSPY